MPTLAPPAPRFFPRISLTAGVGSASSELSGLFKGGSWGFTLAPQLVLPLLDAGRNQSALAAAKVGFDMAVAQYEKSIQSAFREVADALAGRDTLAQQLQAQQAQLEAETARLRLTDLRYHSGAANQLEWLDAQRSQFASQQALVQVRLAYLQNQVALHKTLGGGVNGCQLDSFTRDDFGCEVLHSIAKHRNFGYALSEGAGCNFVDESLTTPCQVNSRPAQATLHSTAHRLQLCESLAHGLTSDVE
jgi:hypothetical protein